MFLFSILLEAFAFIIYEITKISTGVTKELPVKELIQNLGADDAIHSAGRELGTEHPPTINPKLADRENTIAHIWNGNNRVSLEVGQAAPLAT